jgi:hypothetical protein
MSDINIETAIIRAVWSSVETINKQALLHLSDTDIVQQIIEQVECALSLDIQERESLSDYVNSKVRLIKDIVEF